MWLLVIDPLLRKLESASLGLKIKDFFVEISGFAHAKTIPNGQAPPQCAAGRSLFVCDR